MIKAKPSIENVSMPVANTEYSYDIPTGTRKFSVKLRDLGYELKICFVSGESDETYITLSAGKTYTENEIKGSGTLYFMTTANNQVAEILLYK